MRDFLRIGIAAGLLAVAPAAYGADASGTWKGAFDFEGSNVALTFHLTIAGGAMTGTVEGLPTTPAEIHDGKVDGDTMTFWVTTDYKGQSYKLAYMGRISAAGDQIAFTFGTADRTWTAQLTAAKSVEAAPAAAPTAAPAAIDVTGTWKGAFDLNGSSMPLTFHLMSAPDGAVTGTMEGSAPMPAEIHDGKLDGDTITFLLTTDYGGQTYKLVFKGKIAAGQIDLTFGTEDGSWSGQLTVERQQTADSRQ